MKKRKLIFTAMIAGSLLATLPSCDKLEEFGSENANPNQTTSPNTAALLGNVLAGFGGYTWGNAYTTNGALYAQYMSETQYTEASRYAVQSINWSGTYTGALFDLQNIINYNSDPATAGLAAVNGSNANQIATARILKAYIFWVLTDTYGDIPYFEALKGEGALAYDEQSLIYPDLIKELKEAVDQFDGGDIFKGDLIYSGSVAKWKKLANSIRLMMAMRLSKVSAGTAETEVAAALSHPAGVIETNADNFTLKYPGGIYNHPVYQYYNITKRFDYAVSNTITDNLLANNDRRINAFGSSAVGFTYGLDRDDAVAFSAANTDWARVLAVDRRDMNDPIVIVSASQVWLTIAEARQRNWVSGSVVDAYNTGIRLNWEEWGVFDQTAYNNYISAASISLAANALTKIQHQQWLAFYPNGTQGWANWRRTGVPNLTPAEGPGLPIPRRLPYGPDEFTLNKVNADAGADKYTVGGVKNSQDARMWLDN